MTFLGSSPISPLIQPKQLVETIEPITPEQVQITRPFEVIKVFNTLIQQHWDGHKAVFTVKEAIEELCREMKIDRAFIIERRYLDIEVVYQQAGWIVKYDKPGFNETYDATYTFTKET